MAYLIEMTGAVDAAGTLRTFRYSTAAAFMTAPTDNPANAVYEARVATVGNYERDAWSKGSTRGTSTTAWGNVVLANGDGALDAWINYGFCGQSITILTGPEAGPYSAFTPLFTGIIGSVIVGWQAVTVTLLDKVGVLADKPLQVTKYLGNNSLPTGVEGASNDLKGRPKPKLRGTAKNFQPPCVNTSMLIYQIDDGTAVLPMTITVYSASVVATAGVQRASLAALQSNSPTAGTYDYYAGSDGWYIKAGFVPSNGPLTCDASEGTVANRTVAQIVSRLISQEGGFPLSIIDGISALDAAAGYEVGFWESSETTIGAEIDALLSSCNASLTDTRAGRLFLGRLSDPATGASVTTIYDWMIQDGGAGITMAPSNDPGIGVRVGSTGEGKHAYDGKYTTRQGVTMGQPVWRVLLDWGRNLTVQNLDSTQSSATADRIAYLAQDYRTVDVNSPTVKTQYVNAPEFVCQTLIVNATDAATEAAFQLALRSVPRYVVEIRVDPSIGQAIDLMSVFTLATSTTGRFGWSAGKQFLCIGLIEVFGESKTPNSITIVGWG